MWQDGVEFELFLKFATNLRGLTVYRTEWCIFGDEEKLAGSVDMAAINTNGALVLFDWKRSKNLRQKYTNPFQRMRPPVHHLADCQGIHYRLQLNLYRYLIQKYYGYEVAAMRVVCTHPDNTEMAFVDDVPIMPLETEHLMEIQRSRARETSAMTLEDLVWNDPPGGMDMGSQGSGYDLDAAIEEECRELDELASGALIPPSELPGRGEVEGQRPAGSEAASSSGCPQEIRAGTAHESEAMPCDSQRSQALLPEEIGDSLSHRQGTLENVSLRGDVAEGARESMNNSDAEDVAVAEGCASAFHGRAKRFRGADTSGADFESLFATCVGAAVESIRGAPPVDDTDADGILARTACMRRHVIDRFGDSNEKLVCLATAALAIYRMRLVDLFIREHVLLLWIIEGQTYMRVHGGVCYFYGGHGSFQTYKGLH